EYRGVTLEEMDLDALLARRPTVALVDELAHTNAPGSRHGKRYQDIEELLRQGVNVISTLNIQHLESLHDLVERATGVRVKERVHVYGVGRADQLVNVDISAEDLRGRLQAGKVYPKERIEAALGNFFTQDNLTHLRELAMGEIAHRLDRRLQEQRNGRDGGGPERVMVALGSRSPHAAGLLRKAARLADRLGAPWYAIYIQTPSESLERIDAATQRQINNTLELARQLDGTPMTIKGDDVVSGIATAVREFGITHLVLGRTQRPWYRRWFGQSLLDRLLRTVPR